MSIRFLSDDGKSYSFDSRASGYGRGDGISSLVLKPLAEAVRDGDPIRAVIRETAVNQDGKTSTITSPSRESQEDLIRTCYSLAGLDPLDTAYVEAHGTGTIAGDQTESNAIGTVFGEHRSIDDPLFIGSIKANLGHLESASGLASIIKTCMMLDRGLIPPSANFDVPNSAIDFHNLKLKVSLPRVVLSFCLHGSFNPESIRLPLNLRPGQATNPDVCRSAISDMEVQMLM